MTDVKASSPLVPPLLSLGRGVTTRPGEATIKQSAALIAPALLLPIAAVISLSPTLRDSLAIHAAPLIVLGGCALLGIVTGRGRLLLGVLVLGLTMAALINSGSRTIFHLVALLLPVNLGLIAWLGETRALSARGAWWLGVILLQAGAVGIVELLNPSTLGASLARPLVDVDAPWMPLPHLALFAFAVMLGLHLVRFVRGRRPLHAAAAWALVASFLALDTAGSGGPADLHFAAAGMLLALGTVLEPPTVLHLDAVTGLPASLEFNKVVRRLPRRYALACVCIDDFTSFRSEQGPDVSNRMLRLIAQALKKVGGGGRVFYLMRDNEFVVVFRRKSAEIAARHVNVVRRAVERLTLDVAVPQKTKSGARAGVVQRTVAGTISVGIAEAPGRAADPFKVLRAAEEALGQARAAGMNRVVVHQTPARAAAQASGLSA
jgi:GGDEF domain-containing protein